MDDAPPPPPLKLRRMAAKPLKYDSDEASSKEERELYKTFVNAAYRGDLETVKRILETNAVPVDCHDICEEKPLVEGVWIVIIAGPPEYTRNGTALHAVCEYSLNIAVVQELLRAGAQVDLEDKYGATPLLKLLIHRKDVQRQVEITRMLLAAGCNVNAKEKDGWTPLMCVGREDGMDEIFSMLINAGADMTGRCKDNSWSVLHSCCTRDSNVQNVRLLLDHGIDVRQQGLHEPTALHVAVQLENMNVI